MSYSFKPQKSYHPFALITDYCLFLLLKRHSKLNILFQCQGVQEIIILKYKSQILLPEFRKFILCKLCNVCILVINMAGRHPVYRCQKVKKRGLPRTGSSHNSHKFPRLHGKAYTVYCLCYLPPVPVIFFHILDSNFTSHCPNTSCQKILTRRLFVSG